MPRSPRAKCSVETCSSISAAFGLCHAHYYRLRHYGSPLADKPKRPWHGKRRVPEYDIWAAMIQRCHNPKNRAFALYGARGIQVCERWRTSFEAFLSDMGERPSSNLSIDRINNEGDYEPSNCRWATVKQQARNTRRSRYLTIDNQTLIIADWARMVGLCPATIAGRLKRGMDPRDAVFTPATR